MVLSEDSQYDGSTSSYDDIYDSIVLDFLKTSVFESFLHISML